MLRRRFIRQVFFAIRNTHERTLSGSRRLRKILEDLQKRILRHFLGILTVAAHKIAVLEHTSPKIFDEVIECLDLPSISARASRTSASSRVSTLPIVRIDAVFSHRVTSWRDFSRGVTCGR